MPHISALFAFMVVFFYFSSPQRALHAQQTQQGETASGTADIAADNAAQNDTEEEKPQTGGMPPSEKNRTEMEIRTSTLSELAFWCRTLGLSEGGTREELSSRLREHFKLPRQKADSDEKSRKIITIESAQTTEYFRVEVSDEDYARLKGNVILSLQDKDALHKIKANEILFNRTRNILTASGNVST